MTTPKKISLLPFLSPNYWPTWLGLGLLWLVVQLPYTWQLKIGAILGVLTSYVIPKRRKITRVNLKLCFPELSDAERKKLLRDNFASIGIAVIEMAMSWWMPSYKLDKLVTLHGTENADPAFAKGKGIILLGAHFTTLDLAGRICAEKYPFDVLYRPPKNKLIHALLLRRRQDSFSNTIDRNDLRSMIRKLAQNRAIWYAPDQDYGRKYSVFVPFFGVNAATITATARLAKMSGAAVMPVFQYRLPKGQGYEIFVHPALTDFPSGNDEQDAIRINQILEEAIRKAPEQYLWAHRRFKTRPEGEPSFYEK
jgi:KDO2-lipid IV(A) lauroyltransferase